MSDISRKASAGDFTEVEGYPMAQITDELYRVIQKFSDKRITKRQTDIIQLEKR